MSETWKRWEGRVVNGEFPLQRYLGSSDHSAVFLTRRGESGAQNAVLKLILADPARAQAQLLRWQAAAKLSDPGLIRIFDMGRSTLDGVELLYIVTEYADEDLSQILPQRSLTPEEAQQMLGSVLDTLAYLHSQGLVHGSIKPSNVMAVADRVKISSDSLCKPKPGDGSISPVADVWSLGMTLVEALTQKLPVLDPSRPAILPEGIHEPFSTIARHCLQPDPGRRWTVAEIAAQLKPLAAGSGGREFAPATLSQRTSQGKWLALVVVAAIALVALVWMSISRTRTSDPSAQADSQLPGQSAGSDQSSSSKTGTDSSAAAASKTEPAQPTPKSRHSGAAAQQIATPASATAPDEAATSDAGTANGTVTPGVVHAVIPAVSRSARNTIQGRVKVRVRVQVNPSGNVTSAVLDSAGPSKYFARLALDAAHGWTFSPAQADGKAVVSQWILRFTFSRAKTEVVPGQTKP
jgi:TonB family protein